MGFKEKWLETVDKKNSVLCAGLDPAEFRMGRGAKGLPEYSVKRGWSLAYIEAVAPFAAAIKPNFQYFKDAGDVRTLREVTELASHLGLVVIDDSKLADIGSTNDAGVYHSKKSGFDAVTVAPYAGNMGDCADQGRKRDIGIITMCLMSNPEYENEKNMLVPITEEESFEFEQEDVVKFHGQHYVPRYIDLASKASVHGIDGIVIGAPSDENHLSDGELAKARQYAGGDRLVLLPGVGAQGGQAVKIWEHFDKRYVMVNVGRDLMFPGGNTAGKAEHEAAAKHYMEMLNEKRAA